MSRHSLVVFFILALVGGTSASADTDMKRQLQNNPLIDNWAKEEGLANLLNEKIESSQTLSPTNDPTEHPTDMPTNVSTILILLL